jgi:hypothetical protein
MAGEVRFDDGARFWCGPTGAVEMQRILSLGGRQAEIYSRFLLGTA